MSKIAFIVILIASTLSFAADRQLEIYFIDVEGGAATLIVTPAGESVLVDTGNPGERDPGRIAEAAKVAGIKEIDHLVVTHYHVDHMGGAHALGDLMPIHVIYDNADQNPSRDKPSPEYLATRCDKKVMLSANDEIPLKQAEGSPKLNIRCLCARKK